MDKLAKFFKDARSIWVGILGLFMAAAWGGDLRWVKKENYSVDQRVIVIKQINREIGELKTKLLYIQDPVKKAMTNALIINKQTQIENIRESN